MNLKKIPINFHQFLFVLSCLLGVWILFGFVFTTYGKILYPYALNLGEPPLAQTIELMRQGVSPYKSFDQPPFTLMPYGPVYPTLVILLKNWLTGHFIAARWLTSASTLMIASVIGMFAYKRVRSIPISIVLSCIYLLMPINQKWGVQVNVDMTALCLELIAFVFFLKFMRRGGNHALAIAIGFQTLAFFTKSSAIAAGASFALWYLLRRDWKIFWTYSISQACCLLSVFLLLNGLTGGHYYLHTVYEIQNRIFFSQFIQRFWLEFSAQYWMLLMALGVAGIMAFIQKKMTLSMLTLLVAAGLTVSLGKQGSDNNYLLAFVAYMMIVLAEYLPSSKIFRFMYSLPLCLYLLTVMPLNLNFVHNADQQRKEQIEFYEQFSNLIKNTKGPVISWDMSLLLANNKPIYFESFPMAQMAYSGVWDQKPILNAIENKEVSLMVLYFLVPALKGDRNFTPEFIRALKENYQMIGTVKTPWSGTSHWFFYVPKQTEGVA